MTTENAHVRTTRSGRVRAWAALVLPGCAAMTASAFDQATFTGLGYPPGTSDLRAEAISADGLAVVGTSSSFGHAFRWTADEGMAGLTRPFWSLWSAADGFSADGSVIVGAASYDIGGGDTALLWRNGSMEDLSGYLLSLGIDLTGWQLYEATGVSADGRTIVGNGVHNGVDEAWIATIGGPESCNPPGDFDCDGDVDENDFATFRSCFALPVEPPPPDCAAADLDADGDVDCADWHIFLANWTAGDPPSFRRCPRATAEALHERIPVCGGCARCTLDPCTSDDECVIGGCGDEVCGHPGGGSTCDCAGPGYGISGCGCVDGVCAWWIEAR